MEYCQYLSGSVKNMAKEKRLPPKRGQVKLRIVRSISNRLMAAGNAADDDDSNSSQQAADNRNSFRREESYS
ncbi:hypothetical protein E2562_007703 [Oryza meyeriana var. granulata]|uniref:Uncharacterized protein n=1 Tax=Oryza meyeriana var. granulata TaxID=110450 RepID=A0A6G1EHF3_9ORYZ|nr:hypothetical protein E2562_007703 [Oryza meyeriana var. granulata]